MEILFFLGLAILVHVGLAYLSMRFFARFTKKSQYKLLLDGSILILSLLVLFTISFVIIIQSVSLER